MKQTVETSKANGEVTFKVKEVLTVPIVSMAHIERLACQVLKPIEERRIEGFGKGTDGSVKLLRIKNLADDKVYDLVVSAVIESTLTNYGEYVGEKFLFVSSGIGEGKRYRHIDIAVLE